MQSLPLRRQTFRSHLGLVVPNPFDYPMNNAIQDGPRKQWTDKAMAKAINAVEQQGINIRRASEIHQIPRSALHDHTRKSS